ncbi:MAG: FHA domain-containing protein [Gemmatimonadota bacterium]
MPTPRLVPVAPTRGEPVAIDRSPFWIGSSNTGALKIFLPGIGERHASITEREDGYYLSPMAGATPPRVGGVVLSGPVKLQDGQVIELGPAAKYEYISGIPRPKPVEAEPEPEYEEEGPKRRRRWKWPKRRGPKRAGFPVWAYLVIGMLVVGIGYAGVILYQAARNATQVVQGPPQLTDVEGRVYDSLMVEAGRYIERGSTLLELGLNTEALQEFGKAVSVFDGTFLATNELVKPSIEGLFATVTKIYKENKSAIPAGLRNARGKVADLSTALAARLQPDQFLTAVETVQTAFAAKFTRRFEITGADHAEHVALYGKSGARDIRVRDLKPDQIGFLIDSFSARGVRVKDFSKDAILQAQIQAALARGWKDRAGTGLHLHVDRFRDRRDAWTVTK